MERRKYWWNGRSEPRQRQDLLLYEDAGQWWLEARMGGAAGRSRWLEFGDEDAALDVVRALMEGGSVWREL
jgi:hypothetical protein